MAVLGFQGNAFQHNYGFQGGTATVTPTPVGGVSRGKGRPRRRIQVEIGDELFEVASEVEGRELLLRARELAEQTAQRAAERAQAKARGKDKPAALDRAFAVPVPRVRLLNADYSLPATQQFQAQIEAAQVEIEAIYGRIMRVAREHYEAERDEEDAIVMLLL